MANESMRLFPHAFYVQKGRGFHPTLNYPAIRANITEFKSNIMLVSIHSLAADINLKNTHTKNSVCGAKVILFFGMSKKNRNYFLHRFCSIRRIESFQDVVLHYLLELLKRIAHLHLVACLLELPNHVLLLIGKMPLVDQPASLADAALLELDKQPMISL